MTEGPPRLPLPIMTALRKAGLSREQIARLGQRLSQAEQAELAEEVGHADRELDEALVETLVDIADAPEPAVPDVTRQLEPPSARTVPVLATTDQLPASAELDDASSI